jgi:uncharacterized protein
VVMYYLDTCALFKLVKPEKETQALRSWLETLGDEAELVTSELSELELTRALLRSGEDKVRVPYAVREILFKVFLHFLHRGALQRAIAYDTRRLGTLDAIHLATAEGVRNHLTALVTYDGELAAAAEDLGLSVYAPA